MKDARTGPKSAPRALMLCLTAVLLVLTLWIPSAFAADEGVSDMSLYQRASEVARVFGTALAPGSDAENLGLIEGNKDSDKLTAGNAGGFLGYADIMSDDTGVVGWLMNSYTTASATITYDQLQNVVPSSSTAAAGRDNPFFQYAGYGEALTQMGLVNTVRENSIGGMSNIAFTGIVIVVYLLANAAPFLFQSALFLLSALNPFKLFMTVIEGTGNMDLGILSDVADYVGGIYLVVQELSITLLFPMMLGLTFVSVLMFRSGSAMKKFSRYALRVFMLFAGLPLIGATYTGIVEGLDSEVETGADYANYLVLSSYVDFEGWVRESRLAPPSGAQVRNPRTMSDASNETMSLADRSLVLEINGSLAGNPEAIVVRDKYKAGSDISAIMEAGGTRTNVDDSTYKDPQSGSAFRETFGLLTRHLSTSVYSGSQYDGEVAGRVQKMRSAADNKTDGDIVKMFSLTSSEQRTWKQRSWFNDDENAKFMEPIDWKDANGLFTGGAAAKEEFQFGDYKYNIYNGGSMTSTGTMYKADVNKATDGNGLQPIGSSKTGVVGGLSPLAMYNFLNTTFTDTGMTVYSPAKSSSDITRDVYTSVSFAGAGVASWVRWLENVTVMLSLAALSLAYGIMMISAAMRNIPRILTSVFGTALGSIAFATKLLISTAVMLIQVIGMIFLYTLSENIIMTLLLNFNSVTSSVSQYFGAGTVALEFARGVMVILVTLLVTIFLIKNMNVFREMMEEVVTNIINRVMGVLDTSTGGQGLDVAKTSGGRVGADGKLTDDAKDSGTLLGGGMLGGAAGLLGAAHDIEARREQANQERNDGAMLNEDGSEQTAKDRRANRLQTAKDLAGARTKDAAKSMLGVKGKSEEREVDAKTRAINAIAMKDAINPGDGTADNKDGIAGKLAKDGKPSMTNEKGQQLDENGNVVRDENGNAIDAKGNPISSSAPLGTSTNVSTMGAGMAGAVTQANTAKDGTMLDTDGNAYTDENGNAFRQDKNGKLVDENGQHVALDKDGVLKPIASIPGHNGKPVSALREAGKLDGMRFDPNKFGEMQNEQDASHYGLDKSGQVVDANGKEMMARTPNGISPVTMDSAGIITDKDGNKVAAKDLVGPVDNRGFDAVTDPETGETVMQHKGDSAMKPLAMAGMATGATGKKQAKSLSALAQQSNRASDLASRADKRVADLKANGASPYAIAQAQRFAGRANKNAKALQSQYGQAMQDAGKNPQAAARREPVTAEQVGAAYTLSANAADVVIAEGAKLDAMKAAKAPAKDLAKQAERVDKTHAEATRAHKVAGDTKTAYDTGRSFGEVSQARDVAERAEQVFGNAQRSLDAAVQKGAPPAEIQKREQQMQRASAAFSKARSNMERVSQAPSGTPEQIDQATAQHTQAQQQHAQAAARVQQLAHQASPAAVQEAKATEQQAAQTVQQARTKLQRAEQQVQQLQATGAPNSQVVAAKRDVAQATQQVQSAQTTHAQATKHTSEVQQRQQNATPQAAKAAQTAERQASAGVKQAQNAQRQAQQQVQSLRSSGASQPAIQAAEQKVAQATQAVTRAETAHNQAVQQVEATARPQQQMKQAKQAEQQARRTATQTARRQRTVMSPAGWSDEATPTIQQVPQVSPTRSYAELSAAGVNNYGDYKERVREQAAIVKSSDAQIKQAKQRVASMRASNRPPQVIRQAEREIQTYQQQSQAAQAQLSSLQENAQGLLKNGTFQPVVANRPIRKNGAVVVNQLVNLSNTQAMLDNLAQQSEAGTLSDAGKRQMTNLTSKIGNMKRALVSSGIREDAIRDTPSITESTRHMQQSWESFINGTSTEHGE